MVQKVHTKCPGVLSKSSPKVVISKNDIGDEILRGPIGWGEFKRKKLLGNIIRSAHKFEPFWQQVYNKCPPTYNTGAENVPKKASDTVGMYGCGVGSFLIR